MQRSKAPFLSCLLFVPLSALAAAPVAARGAQEEDSLRLLVVRGDAEVSAAPDHAIVALGATAQAPEAATAQSQVNQAMQKAIAAIRELGIPAQEIQTAGLSLHPVLSRPRQGGGTQGGDDTPRIAAYRASNTVRVQLDDLSAIGGVIDAGIGAGANQLEGISFQLRDDTTQRAEALRQAAQNARSKADALAQAAGVGLLTIQRIEEGGVGTVHPQADYRMAAMEAGTPVQPGEVRVRASVTITYRLSVQPQGSGGDGG